MSVTNNANLDYYSLTHYQASESGVLDLDKTAPVTGAYRQVDAMSIFWTMKPRENSDQRFWSINVEEGLHCKFQVYDGTKVGRILDSFRIVIEKMSYNDKSLLNNEKIYMIF